ncbi:superoxide dismutase family protein [Umezawaea beigongshangensis]|uniref:superoxide dismutase family protein n=1 Tax=Umezawaea beigongshangensis TaxID=2780383 RepID=UPI0018F2677E|nr:superoxide dismutase family protein [Umezawaea beigongshangensis]
MRTTAVVLVGAATLVGGLTACAPGDRPSTQTTPTTTSISMGPAASSSASAGSGSTGSAETPIAFATPAPAGEQPEAVTYSGDLVPVGAEVSVKAEPENGSTTVTLDVTGLLPDHDYGAHVHTSPCGPTGADAGPHYQNEADPVTPSVDPAYANPENEIWLDITTDAEGAATATATVDWEFRDGGASSAVIHAEHTATEAGRAGTAGDRLACVTHEF